VRRLAVLGPAPSAPHAALLADAHGAHVPERCAAQAAAANSNSARNVFKYDGTVAWSSVPSDSRRRYGDRFARGSARAPFATATIARRADHESRQPLRLRDATCRQSQFWAARLFFERIDRGMRSFIPGLRRFSLRLPRILRTDCGRYSRSGRSRPCCGSRRPPSTNSARAAGCGTSAGSMRSASARCDLLSAA
jgi:hypothetical protein